MPEEKYKAGIRGNIYKNVAEFNPIIDPGLAGVERRWREVTDMLDTHLSNSEHWGPHDDRQCFKLLGELDCLYTLTQYMGSNARTGWLIQIRIYSKDVKDLVDGVKPTMRRCIRESYHTGPCNGFPREDCLK